jgi:type VI secretion system secreted protein Hcp
MKHLHPAFAIIVLCLSISLNIQAQVEQPVIALVSVQGTKTGNFKGSSNIKGREGQIECVGYSYSVQTPRDASTGMPSGKRQHSPVTIVKHMDEATAQLLQAAYTNENLKSVAIEFFKVAANGKLTPFQIIRLTNASISKVNQYGGTASPEKVIPNNNPYEEISFTFQKIEISIIEGKTTATDDWSAQN